MKAPKRTMAEAVTRTRDAGSASPATRVASVMYVALGLGFGVGALITLAHHARTGELPMTPWGFRAFSGPFERHAPRQFRVLLWGLVGVCAADVLAGAWLWSGRQRGATLGSATTLPALALGAGFALPFLLVGVPMRVALVLAGRRTLR